MMMLMRVPPCRVCHKALVPTNFGYIDYVVCEDCYNDILKKNKGRHRYARLSIEAMRDTWGPAKPTKAQKRYERAMARRAAFAKFMLWVFFILAVFCVIGSL